jgi:hypothetical protein
MNRKSLWVGLMIGLFVVATTMPAFAECWAAIALNQGKRTAAVGTGPTLWDAQKDAMQKAGMPGAAIWSWARDKFLAMAADSDNPGIFGMDLGATQEEADQTAIAYCQKMKGKNCKVVTRGGCAGGPQPQEQQVKPWGGDPVKPGPSPNPLPENQKFKW